MSHRRQSSSASSSTGGGEHLPAGQGASSSTEGNVQVVLRIRPMNAHDLASIPPRFQRLSLTPASSTTVSVDAGSSAGATGSVSGRRSQTLNFHYDRVLGPDDGQRELYEAAASKLVDKFIQGFNVTILAYGQTSSGKSYSMGTALEAGANDEREILPSTGLVPRAVTDIFAKCAEMERQAGGRSNVQCEMTNSFVELYNEDLLDLLSNPDPSTPVSERPTVSIREDKDGKIIWSGLRETRVHSREDVMRNLQQGSVLRRTNETDMNAQSSRSHAIFSITLTQRKRVGSSSIGGNSGVPSSSASTVPTSGAPPSAYVHPSAPSTPSRGIPRPSSAAFASVANARTMSPTPNSRPTTPSGLPLLHQRTSSGLRPASTVGTPRAASPLVDDDDAATSPGRNQGGEWVTVTSKFHFVDLAGSERLKRTSAAGERMKEGISINSGLLALGNVISALGDPAKARTMTHIPYRDSKLTRLLQDSLGGNAHTLMIACVSPAEFNLTETLSTIKYANRARNIKNRAEVNQMEVGWDDIEHLQTTLLKLRKEHAALKAAAAQAGVSAGAVVQAGGNDLSSISEEKPGSVAMNRLNSQFSDLQHEHAALSDRYRETMIEVARLTRQVEEAKSHGRDGGSTSFAVMVQPVIEEYEKAIAQMEEELKLSRAALAHTNDLYNEQEIQLAEAVSRNAKAETYNAELRSRIGKLVEREASNETYIRDLETKLSTLNERDDSRGVHVTNLRKEVAQLKQSDGSSTKYLSELEAQLATAESTSTGLAAKIDRLEKEIARREAMYRDLEARLDAIDTTEENKLLLRELDEKDHRVADLERKLEDALHSMEVVGRERASLQARAAKDEAERISLKTLIQRSRESATNGRLAPPLVLASRQSSTDGSTYHTPAGELSDDAGQASDDATPTSRTPIIVQGSPADDSQDQLELQLRDLQMAHTRTLTELDEISAKYRDALKEIAELSAELQGRERPPRSPSRDGSVSPTDLSGSIPRSGSRGSLASAAGSPTSVRQRTSLGRSSLPSGSSIATKASASTNGQGFGGRGGGHLKQMPLSLSQESSSLPSSRSSWGGSGATLLATSPVRSLSLSPQPERSVQSLEDEIMSLQKVLKQREDEIDHLEEALKLALPHKTSSASLRSDAGRDNTSLTVSGSDERRSLSRASTQQPSATTDEQVQNRRMDDLLKSMARMETTHRETVEALTAELAKTRRGHGDLLALSRDQALNVSAELDGLRNSLALSEDRNEDLCSQLRASAGREQDAADSRARLIAEHQSSADKLRSEHEAALASRTSAGSSELTRLRASHADDLKRAELKRNGTLSESQEEHAAAIATLHQQHVDRLADREAELISDLGRVQVEHAKALDSKETGYSATLERLRVDHAAAIARLAQEKSEETERLRVALSKSREEHIAALQQVRAEAEQRVAAAEEGFRTSLVKVQADHESALDKLEEHLSSAVIAAEDALGQLETAKEEHSRELALVTAGGAAAVAGAGAGSRGAPAGDVDSLLATIASQKSVLDAAVHERSVAQTTIDDFAARHGSLEKDHVELRTLSANRTDELKASLDRSAAKIAELESILTDRDTEAKGLLEEIDALQAEVNLSRSERQQLSQAAASHVSVLSELDSHRATLSTVQQELLATKAELEALHVDRTRQEEAMRELQRRMSDYTTSPTTDPSEFLTDGKQRPLSINIGRSASPLGRSKPPPPTPPPNMPPPPLPLSFPAYGDAEGSASRPHSQVQTIRTNSISSTSGRRSPRSSSSIDGNAFPAPPPGPDPRLLAQLEDQRENVKNLNKRLQHCEADLQANIDLVNTLEAALNDSERALRKARLSANDIAKERDRASSECETLRSLLQHARAEVLSVKSSADNDSRQLEEKMASEMRQRENAKRELEERLEAMQSRKSKFNCF